jgi:hypothetical protein
MKYFKFAKISKETGISWAIAQPISGPSWPDIPGLDLNTSIQLSHNSIYYIAQVDDTAEANPENHIFELTTEEYAQEIKQHVMHMLNKEKDSIYQEEHNFRQSIFSKYHETATTAGIYKYEQAKSLLENEEADAPDVRAEASARGVNVTVLAQRIVENHESFRQKEAKIAGIRGKILDRLEEYEFDLNGADASYAEFLTEEVIGTKTYTEFENGESVEKEVDVKVRKYSLSLGARFQYE